MGDPDQKSPVAQVAIRENQGLSTVNRTLFVKIPSTDRQRLLDRPRHMREPARYRTVTGAPRVVPDRARNRQTPSRALAGLRSLCSVSMLGLGDGG